MSSKSPFRSGYVSGLLAALCAVLMVPGGSFASSALSARQTNMQAPAPVAQTSTIPSDQLDSLVAPIALYPDPLLAQTLAASTYPLEVLQLQQWLAKNPGLKGQALLDAVEKQPWDPSVQALAALPDVATRLANDIQWTTDLGNAFLAQEADVMHAVQRMRQKAQAKGNLVSTPQQTVETQVIESQPVIVIEQTDPQVVYVPSYNPAYVYGPPVYPYPPIYYPPSSYGWFPGAGALAFGTGVALGAAWGGGWGGWGWGANWGNADININRNNAFVRNANIAGTGNRWQHNVAHRGGTPYRDQATASRFGGTARGESLSTRQANARQQVSRQGGNLRSSGAVGTTGVGGRASAAGLGERAGQGGLSNRAGQGNLGQGNLGNRPSRLPSQGGLSNRAGQGGLSTRPSQGGLSSRPSGSNSISGRDLSRGGSSAGAFGGGSGGFNGSSARSSSSRGSSSMRSSSSRGSRSGGFSGGGSRGGGGRGGGGRGGGRR